MGMVGLKCDKGVQIQPFADLAVFVRSSGERLSWRTRTRYTTAAWIDPLSCAIALLPACTNCHISLFRLEYPLMPEPSKSEHWNSLLNLIGLAGEEAPATPAASESVAPPAAPPAKPVVVAPPPRREPPKPAPKVEAPKRSSWSNVLGALGLAPAEEPPAPEAPPAAAVPPAPVPERPAAPQRRPAPEKRPEPRREPPQARETPPPARPMGNPLDEFKPTMPLPEPARSPFQGGDWSLDDEDNLPPGQPKVILDFDIESDTDLTLDEEPLIDPPVMDQPETREPSRERDDDRPRRRRGRGGRGRGRGDDSRQPESRTSETRPPEGRTERAPPPPRREAEPRRPEGRSDNRGERTPPPRREETSRREELPRREEGRREEPRRADGRQDRGGRSEGRRDEVRRTEPRSEEPRRSREPRREELHQREFDVDLDLDRELDEPRSANLEPIEPLLEPLGLDDDERPVRSRPAGEAGERGRPRRRRRRGSGRGDRAPVGDRPAAGVPADELDEVAEARADQENARARQRLEETDDIDTDGDEDELGGEHGHSKIPTWQETVGMLIENNMASRNRQPDHGGRGGRRGGGRGGR